MPSDQLIVLNADDTIRRNERFYFSSIGPHPVIIASRIAEGALLLGCMDVVVSQADGWWFVAGSSDWFNAPNAARVTEDNAFDATWALPELGQNCFRGEIFARIYASATITSSTHVVRVVKGSYGLVPEYQLLTRKLPHSERVIGFKFSNDV